MKNWILLFTVFSLSLLSSCSSDPCESVTCANGGVCMDGTCDCPDGWTGADCSQFDFTYTGTFVSKYLSITDCNDASGNRDRSRTSDENNYFCADQSDGSTYCIRLKLEVNSDNTYKFILVERTIRGALTLSSPDILEGQYNIGNTEIELCDDSGSCFSLRVNQERSGYLLTLPTSTTAQDGCKLTYELIRE